MLNNENKPKINIKPKAKTAQGKGRAFIRYALMQKSLADAIQLLLVDEKLRK